MADSRGQHRGSRSPRPNGPRPANRLDPARLAAFELLRAVDAQDAYANLVWPAILRSRRLVGRDAAFATELAYGTFRWRGRHDVVLGACLDRPIAQLQRELLDVLRLGVHQLHEMRVGSHAAVDQSVELARAQVNPGAGGLVNAVLRRVDRGGGAEEWMTRLTDEGVLASFADDPPANLAVTTSHPVWVVRSLHEALHASQPERTWEDTRAALLADNTAGPVTLVARTLSRDELIEAIHEQVPEARPGLWSRLAVRVSSVNPAGLTEVATGAAGVQDEGSQVVALLLADAAPAAPGERWLDLCAGPGGKSAVLAEEVARSGGQLTAVELHPHRADLVRAALRPIQGRHEVLVADALTDDIGSGYDRVLVDAPCTGLGALRRRPESRWRRDPADLPGLTALQRGLLARALEVVRPGGLVLYATCSPHLAETEAVVAEVAALGGELVPLDEVATVHVPDGGLAEGNLRLWPHRHDTDGMFAALIRAAR